MKLASTTALAAVAAFGLSTAAFAEQIDNQNWGTDVSIEVLPIVSVWNGAESIEIEMTGADGNGFAGVATSLAYVNNVPAVISATVTGDLPSGGNDEILFFIFGGTSDVAAARAAARSPAYAPAGAKVWRGGSTGNMGEDQPISGVLAKTNLAGSATFDMVLAVASPGGTPDLGTHNLGVVYTIAESNGTGS